MPVKNHRRNTHFQIVQFLAGACHTVDGRYSQLCELREEREMSVSAHLVCKMKNEARLAVLCRKRFFLFWDKAARLAIDAEEKEIKDAGAIADVCYEAALGELGIINGYIEALHEHREFKHLTDPQAHEAAQEREWECELLHQARLSFASVGFLPADKLGALMMLPAWETRVMPVLLTMMPLQSIQNLGAAFPQLKEQAQALLDRHSQQHPAIGAHLE